MLEAERGRASSDGAGASAGAIGVDRQRAVMDILFIWAIFAVLWLPHIGGVGFASDDWAFLAALDLSGQSSIRGLFGALYDDGPRPLQWLYLAAMYRFFGLDPLGYQVINGIVILFCGAGFYLVLRALRLPRFLILAAPLLFLVIPYYATNRLWMAAFQIPLSVLLYLISLHLDLAAREWRGLGLLFIRIGSALSLIASLLAYEITAFLFLLNPFIVLAAAARTAGIQRREVLAAAGALLLNLALVGAVLFLKAQVTERANVDAGLLDEIFLSLRRFLLPGSFHQPYGPNMWRLLYVNHIQYGIGLPAVALSLLPRHVTPVDALLAVGAGLATFVYLFKVLRRSSERFARPSEWLIVVVAGFFVFFAGYGIFFMTPPIQVTPTGIGNRTAMAAALGAAVSLAAAIGWLAATLLTPRARALVLATTTALATACGVLISLAISSSWVVATRVAQETVAAIHEVLPSLPAGSVVLLDGVCPYVGPAIVFETHWDLAGALMIAYGDGGARADVVRDGLEVTEDGIATWIYEVREDYPFGPDLLLVNVSLGESVRLVDRNAADRYFERAGAASNFTCPYGSEGFGVSLF
jgi:hypothetical protein